MGFPFPFTELHCIIATRLIKVHTCFGPGSLNRACRRVYKYLSICYHEWAFWLNPCMKEAFMKRIAVISLLIMILGAFPIHAASGKPYSFDEFIKVKWVKDPQVSPDGKMVAFVVETKDLNENNSRNALWVLDIRTRTTVQFTSGDHSSSHPRWSPDGRWIAFTSDRDKTSQIYVIPSDGGEARKVTDLAAGSSDAEWSRDGKKLIFTSEVYRGCTTEEENKKRLEEEEKSKVSARVYSELPYRVFDHWRGDKRSHLFTIAATGGKAIDLTPGDFDVPPIDLGGTKDYEFSPDSKEVCYVSNTESNLAWSTNNDLFIVPSSGGTAKRITENNACDCNPRYSPDGRYIAYTAMERPGYEADRRCVILWERSTGKRTNLTGELDRSVEDLQWSPDSRTIFFCAGDEGFNNFYRVDCASRKIDRLTGKSYNTNLCVNPDGKSLIFRRESMAIPPEIFRMDVQGKGPERLTSFNSKEFSEMKLNPAEEFRFKAKDGTAIHGFLIKPPDFDPAKKYPLIYFIHGGPQNFWGDDFHPRWNTELFTTPGYVVAAVNFRGSTSYGQKFADAVSGDWGGKPYEDIMDGLDYLLKTCPFIDEKRLSAVGASYGGYMVNWILGHTDRFRTAISHAGVFNTVSEYGTTEELWFPEWEFKGTPYDSKENYEKWSPVNFVAHFKTPCLVIQGQNDFRVPASEGMQLFTALQRNNIPSKFLLFPDETHFVKKPQNLQFWYKTMFEWLQEWLKK